MQKILAAGALTAAIAAGTALPAAAHHTHVRHVGQTGDCVIVADGAGEAEVDRPDVIFTLGISSDPEGGADHPLHVLVHKGQPNADGAGSDWQLSSSNDCAVFVNQR